MFRKVHFSLSFTVKKSSYNAYYLKGLRNYVQGLCEIIFEPSVKKMQRIENQE